MGVPTEIRCGFAVLALLIDEGVDPLESFLECPPRNGFRLVVWKEQHKLPLTHESADTATVSVICRLIQVLLGCTPAG